MNTYDKTVMINDFISTFDDLRTVTEQELQKGLQNILGETPAVDFEYSAKNSVNEKTGRPIFDKELTKIHILYSYMDENNMPKIGKNSYIVG